ncbi:dUTP diphosphatase [Aureimonas sp. AU40]|uniref:dUTP diphosphatase n=1 Tax=Aureimonas sp. AU40 TaxID=1637747 RepID=UPI000782CFA2|nr:dUTP diphosphatase [Aureimonas sp. AU40]
MSELPGTGPHIGVHRLPHAEGLDLPAYASAGAAGADLRAAVEVDVTIPPLGRALVPSGLVFDIPEGFEIQVRPRSGLAARHGVTVLNTPGTIDSDYRGEVMAILVNLGSEPFVVTRGERIAQLVVATAPQARFAEVDGVGETARGAGGFGSTGRA